MRPRPASFLFVVAVIFVVLGAASNNVRAQAWVGDKGELDLSLDYNLGLSSKVIQDKGQDLPKAGTTTHQISLGAEYVPIPKLAVGLSLPIVFLQYSGDKMIYPHPGGGSYDDGSTHGALTDLRTTARYQVLAEPVALSPHLGFSLPVMDYETVGNTVAGRHLKALHLGLGVGTVIGTAAYVHLLYEFSLVEKYDRTAVTEQFGQNRSDLAFTAGYKLLEQRLDVHADFNGRIAHGGINFSEIPFSMPMDDRVLYHDAILKEDIFLVGAGVGYQISNALSVSLSGRYFVAGANTQNASVLALGFAWSPL